VQRNGASAVYDGRIDQTRGSHASAHPVGGYAWKDQGP
jgi:hypothetical protein